MALGDEPGQTMAGQRVLPSLVDLARLHAEHGPGDERMSRLPRFLT